MTIREPITEILSGYAFAKRWLNEKAQIVIAAGPVITEPSSGPSVKIASHQEAGVLSAIAETLAMVASVKPMIGNEPAIAMITTTKIASETLTLPTYSTIVERIQRRVLLETLSQLCDQDRSDNCL